MFNATHLGGQFSFGGRTWPYCQRFVSSIVNMDVLLSHSQLILDVFNQLLKHGTEALPARQLFHQGSYASMAAKPAVPVHAQLKTTFKSRVIPFNRFFQ